MVRCIWMSSVMQNVSCLATLKMLLFWPKNMLNFLHMYIFFPSIYSLLPFYSLCSFTFHLFITSYFIHTCSSTFLLFITSILFMHVLLPFIYSLLLLYSQVLFYCENMGVLEAMGLLSGYICEYPCQILVLLYMLYQFKNIPLQIGRLEAIFSCIFYYRGHLLYL